MRIERHYDYPLSVRLRVSARRRRAQRGLTLIELMIAFAIAAVVLGLALPGFQDLAARIQLSSASQEFLTSLQLARTEATRIGGQVTLRRSVAARPGNWGGGWTMFADADGNGELGPGERVIRDGAPLAAQLTLFGSSGFSDFVSFGRDGRLTNASGGAFVLCSGGALTASGQPRSRALLVSSTGRVRMAVDSDGDGIPEKETGPVSSCTSP